MKYVFAIIVSLSVFGCGEGWEPPAPPPKPKFAEKTYVYIRHNNARAFIYRLQDNGTSKDYFVRYVDKNSEIRDAVLTEEELSEKAE